jgi:hypothetical protein
MASNVTASCQRPLTRLEHLPICPALAMEEGLRLAEIVGMNVGRCLYPGANVTQRPAAAPTGSAVRLGEDFGSCMCVFRTKLISDSGARRSVVPGIVITDSG